MLKAIGKFIDTLPLRNLLSLEEVNSDTIVIEVDRFHDTLDLSEFTFVMRGVTSSKAEMHSELHKEISQDGNFIHLQWKISSLFTTEPGTLFLDLMAYQYLPDTDSAQNPPDYLLRFQLPSIEIRDIPKGLGNASDEQSYTAFWMEMKEQLRRLQDAVQGGSSAADEQNAKIQNLQDSVGEQGERIRSMLTAIGEHTNQIEELKSRTDILVMTQKEYDQLEQPDEHTLYVLT